MPQVVRWTWLGAHEDEGLVFLLVGECVNTASTRVVRVVRIAPANPSAKGSDEVTVVRGYF
jgi:hypothetical protein